MQILGVLFLLFFTSLSWARVSDDNLTFLLAQLRRQQVKSVEYHLHFELTKNAKGYSVQETIDLELNSLKSDLSLDSLNHNIKTLIVNGIPLTKFVKRTGSFDIPAGRLAQKTKIEILYSGIYNNDSSGFQRSIDPEDKSEYVFTDIEPYNAHKLFPSLDQPDLKAIFHVTVKAPSDWTVIGNELVTSSKKEGDFTLTQFQPSKPISTYLFFLGAGPYTEWKDQLGSIPIYLYARTSLAKYVDVENIMNTTKKGLVFFNKYFGYDYPFLKYGQIFIPEFAWGGMENPGAIALNERNIFRGPVPSSIRDDRDNLILHEMAHMWFGDLVTMEWWNDLWLNESFATYLASIAQERALKNSGTWMDFFSTKSWGYWQDQLVTTHPIETDVPDVRVARGNFDGITYAKGASALKQLHYYVGEKGFQSGLQNYFKTFAYANTRRSDFIGSIAVASALNLDEWTQKWLQTAGPNQVEVKWACEKDKIKSASVVQKKSVSGNLSPHRFQVGLYEKDGGELELEETLDVTYSQENTDLPTWAGKDCPDFVMPNVGDQDYALFTIDPASLTLAKFALTKLPDSLSRRMLWNILSEMLRNETVAPVEYFEIVSEGLRLEEDDVLLGLILDRHSSIRDQYFIYLSPVERAQMAPKFETILMDRVMKAHQGSSLQMTFFDFYLTVAQTPESQRQLFEILTQNTPPKGIVIDQDRRWVILQALSRNGHPEALKLAKDELKKDHSTQGIRSELAIRAAFPDLKSKQKMWKEFSQNKELTYSSFREAAAKFHGSNSPELSRPFVNEFFKKVTSMDWNKNDDVVGIYFDNLFPFNLCDQETAKLSANKLKSARNLTSLAKRTWRESQDELERCVRVRSTLKNLNE